MGGKRSGDNNMRRSTDNGLYICNAGKHREKIGFQINSFYIFMAFAKRAVLMADVPEEHPVSSALHCIQAKGLKKIN